MINFGSGSTVIKSKLISKRMFLLTSAKAIVFLGIFGRLVSLQIRIDLESGNLLLKEGL